MEELNLARYFSDYLSKCGGKNTEIIEAKGGNIFKYLVICTAEDKYSAQNILLDLLEYAKSQFNIVNLGIEGYKKAEWIIVDFGKIFVHIFDQKSRQKFNVDKLWK